jgi:hypothetical protein
LDVVLYLLRDAWKNGFKVVLLVAKPVAGGGKQGRSQQRAAEQGRRGQAAQLVSGKSKGGMQDKMKSQECAASAAEQLQCTRYKHGV